MQGLKSNLRSPIRRKKHPNTRVWEAKNNSQEELEGLVQKERLRSICWGSLNLGMENLAWKYEIKRV